MRSSAAVNGRWASRGAPPLGALCGSCAASPAVFLRSPTAVLVCLLSWVAVVRWPPRGVPAFFKPASELLVLAFARVSLPDTALRDSTCCANASTSWASSVSLTLREELALACSSPNTRRSSASYGFASRWWHFSRAGRLRAVTRSSPAPGHSVLGSRLSQRLAAWPAIWECPEAACARCLPRCAGGCSSNASPLRRQGVALALVVEVIRHPLWRLV